MQPAPIVRGLDELLRELVPGARDIDVRLLGADTQKAQGYGKPLRISLADAQGTRRQFVFHTATANAFGHDRRSDRAAELLLAYDAFNGIPDHVRALDVGAILPSGRLFSLREGGEFYLLTTYAEGVPYADHLRRVAAEGVASDGDLARCSRLAAWLSDLHAQRSDDPPAYVRAVRDLVGSGEGIFGIADSYGPMMSARLRRIEENCLAWRWRLRGRERRLCRTHGDFHPFNVVFDGDAFTLLDASRGCRGDAADDVTAMAINYVFFAAQKPQAWRRGFGPLWRRFWSECGDGELFEVAAPWLAWRALVVCSPRFYPDLAEAARDAILSLAERALSAPRFDPAWAEELFP